MSSEYEKIMRIIEKRENQKVNSTVKSSRVNNFEYYSVMKEYTKNGKK